MKKSFIKYMVAVCMVLPAFLSHGQEQDRRTGYGFMDHLREKVLVHTDRSIYFSGERVWFRADYLLNGKKKRDPLSKVLYIQLFSESGEAVVGKKYRIGRGFAKGGFLLPEDLPTGHYILRAYTRYQRNFSETGFTHRRILVVHPSKADNFAASSKEGGNILVVPEGGEWVRGIPHRMAIALPPTLIKNVRSVYVTGDSLRQKHPLEPSAGGVAEIMLTPSDTLDYRVEVVTRRGDTIRKHFPEYRDHGISASTHLKNDRLEYRLRVKPAGKGGHRQVHQLHLITDNLKKVFAKKIRWGKAGVDVAIPYDSLRQGIHYAVLYDRQEKIRKINPVYIPAARTQEISIRTDRQVYAPREKIRVGLQSSPVSTEGSGLSVSVIQKGTYAGYRDHLSPLYMRNPHLLPEMLGLKEDGAWKKQLELSMILFQHLHLGDGIRERISSGSPSLEHLPETRDLSITGTIRTEDGHRPISGRQVCLSVHSGNPQFHVYKTTASGDFTFTLNNFSGLQNIYLYPLHLDEDETNFELVLNRSFHGGSPRPLAGEHPIDSSYKPLLEEIYVNHQISMAEPGLIRREDKKSTSSIFSYFGHRVNTIDLDDYIELDDMEQVFLELVHQVQVKKDEEAYSFRIVGDRNYYRMLPGEPLVFLDNIPLFDHNKIMELHPSQVEKIGVVNEPYVLGDKAFNGVIMISTNTDHFAGIETPESSVFAEYQGLTRPAEFPVKQYPEDRHKTRKPDFRTLLYWDPHVQMDEGSASLSFYASDRQAQYDIVVRGFQDGEYVYGKKTITVSGKEMRE
jgi:hypothetical protein